MTTDTALILLRDPNCLRCGILLATCPSGYSGHHRWLRSQGGPDVPSNRIGLCGTGTTGCHGWAHARRPLAELAAWILPSRPPPVTAQVPVFCAWRGWILLDDTRHYGWRPFIAPEDGPGRAEPPPGVFA